MENRGDFSQQIRKNVTIKVFVGQQKRNDCFQVIVLYWLVRYIQTYTCADA